MAKESIVSDFSSPEFPKEVEIIPLPGHFFDMVGFRTPDNMVFHADCVSSQATLEKYGVTFIYDVAAYLKTLSDIEELKAEIFVPSHANPCDDISELAVINRQKVYEIEQVIKAICDTPKTTDAIFSEIFRKFNLTMTIEQYVLVGSTVKSYLSWMKDHGVIDFVIDFATNNCMLSWKVAE